MKASAGSGKTYNLARKYISLLLENNDRYAYRHILAVTFTNKATDEMKNRILKELHVLAVSPEKSGYFDSFVPSVFQSVSDLRKKAETVLRDILHDYSAFAISTIDRFFQQTLKAFSREIGQFASYQVELDKESLVAESVDRVLDSLTEEDGTLLSWLTSNVLEQIEKGGRYSPDANLMEMAFRLKSPQRQELMESAGLSDELQDPKERLLAIRERCREIETSFRERVRSKARAVLDLMEQAGVSAADTNRGFMLHLYDYADLSDTDPIPAPSASFISKAEDKDKWFAKAKSSSLLPLVYPVIESPLEDFCSLFGKDLAVYNTAVILDGQLYGLGAAGELDRTFRELMKEKNVLCIDDSNTILRDIIDGSDAPFVYEKTGVRYEHFLLDEFQDTARVQWLNFSPLLHNSDSQGGENLIVGDVKQSIYRWRGSDWQLLNETLPDEFPMHKETLLNTNYRSLADIVEFNNGFFREAALVLDEMNGCDGAGPVSSIYADVSQKAAWTGVERGSVSLTFCEKDMELQMVLNSIMEVCASGAVFSDIAVLVRSNAAGEAVASYLIDNGVTVITDDSLKVKGAVTVRRLVSLMSYMDNPQNTVNGYLAAALELEQHHGYCSLIDMAESMFRSIREKDEEGIWKGEVLHIQSFMDYLQDYTASNGNNLRGFLKYWEGENPSISSPSSGNSVKVMTIHKSKGLDFPYVIIPFVENIGLFKPDSRWCIPELAGTELEGVAEGVYDVMLSASSESSLFAEDVRKERFLQHVDNINTLYVAMTRPSLGMHIIAKTPPASFFKSMGSGSISGIRDFSHILYRHISSLCSEGISVCSKGDGYERFDIGEIVDFKAFSKVASSKVAAFETAEGNEYPSIALNPFSGEPDVDVRERGRLRFSADSLDYFSSERDAGISASNRIRGVVLHGILSDVVVPSDLDNAVAEAVSRGEITSEDASEILCMLTERIVEVSDMGWFPESPEKVLNETTLVDIDGSMHRPDRVVISDGKVFIIDYKSGEHRRSYERQLSKYADIWRRMGYGDVSSYLWYVHTGEIVKV